MSAHDSIEATQADRDAAAPFAFNSGLSRQRVLDGKCDNDRCVQAFAKHRATSHAQGKAEGIEAAAIWHEEQADQQAAHQAAAELAGADRSAAIHERHRLFHAGAAVAIREMIS